MEFDLILVGRAMDYENPIRDFFAIHDPSYENPRWVDFGELGIELDSLRELIAAR